MGKLGVNFTFLKNGITSKKSKNIYFSEALQDTSLIQRIHITMLFRSSIGHTEQGKRISYVCAWFAFVQDII